MRTRRALTAAGVALLATTLCVVSETPAAASPGGTTTVTTKSGLSLTATPVRRLDPAGVSIRVTGRGYDMTAGIYVALCVIPAKGKIPSPCGGGVNLSGKNPASAWISSNPPPYGSTLAIPYKKGGRFSVRLEVSSAVADGIDCRTTRCAIVTRADHTHLGDRRFDVYVPVRFAP